MVGKVEGKSRRGWQRSRWLDSIIDSMDMNLSKFQDIVEDRGAWHAAVYGVAKRSNLARSDKSSIHRIVKYNLIYALLNRHKIATYPKLHNYQNHLGWLSKLRILDGSSREIVLNWGKFYLPAHIW